MEVGQGPNWDCRAKEKKIKHFPHTAVNKNFKNIKKRLKLKSFFFLLVAQNVIYKTVTWL
jgi:hypothetical protein